MKILDVCKRLFISKAEPYEDGYWDERAKESGWCSVMWRNSRLNDLADNAQWDIISRHLPQKKDAVLDLGCGTGRMARRLSPLFASYTGIDLQAMIREAQKRYPNMPNAHFVAKTVHDYEYPDSAFDCVISLGCLSCACSANELPVIIKRISQSVCIGGRIILVEPFHVFPLLVRSCKITPNKVKALFLSNNCHSLRHTGLLFAPTRVLLSRRYFDRYPRLTSLLFHVGEFLLMINPLILSDYSFLVFKRQA